jgi:transcription factor STE12
LLSFLCPKCIANHFYRHRRIHEQQQNGESIDNFSEEDMENEHDHLISLEEEQSPEQEHALLDMTSNGPVLDMGPAMSMNTGTHMNGASMNGTSMAPPQMIAAHHY